MSPIATSAPTDETSTITQKLAYLLTPSKEEVIRYGTAEHPYSTLPETTEDLPWADLITLELSKFDEPGGKQFLANQLKEAVKLTGFFYITSFGIPQEEVDAQFSFAKQVFDLPIETKAKHQADFANGGYNGYTGADLDYFKSQGIERRKNVEVFNLPKWTADFEEEHKNYRPKPVQDNIEAIEKFGKDVHNKVIIPLLVVLAVVLELEDEQYFVKRHVYEKRSEDHLRYMKYAARSDAENQEAKELYGAGHTDLGVVTLLFRQPVAALQVLGKDSKWRWVKPIPGSISANFADTIQLLTGRFLPSSIHRVHVPPKDQAQFDRLGVLYFVRPNNDVLVELVPNSPVLEREGIYAREAQAVKPEGGPITVETWVKARQQHLFSKAQGERYKKVIESNGQNEEGTVARGQTATVAGIEVKYYN
ncbi:hypothetical protein BDY24DRAFT_439506 [Mrakia frigida]|uniref:uncharacterized protein n=1 Tax=Mrakia frigida TaxID=29902 RepID=UPI003FCC00F9